MKNLENQRISPTRKQRKSMKKNQNKTIESYMKANRHKIPSPELGDKIKITKRPVALTSPDSTKIRDLPVGEIMEYLGMRRNLQWNKLWFLVRASDEQLGIVNPLSLIDNTEYCDTTNVHKDDKNGSQKKAS